MRTLFVVLCAISLVLGGELQSSSGGIQKDPTLIGYLKSAYQGALNVWNTKKVCTALCALPPTAYGVECTLTPIPGECCHYTCTDTNWVWLPCASTSKTCIVPVAVTPPCPSGIASGTAAGSGPSVAGQTCCVQSTNDLKCCTLYGVTASTSQQIGGASGTANC